MEKFKYEVYDYHNIGLKMSFFQKDVNGKNKICFQRKFTKEAYENYKRWFSCPGRNYINLIVAQLKNNYAHKITGGWDFNFDDFDWEWKIITPEGTYKSDETSSKKE